MTQHKKILKLKDLELAYQAAQHYDVIPNLGKAPELINDYGLKCNLDRMEDVLFLYRGETSADILNRIIELIREL